MVTKDYFIGPQIRRRIRYSEGSGVSATFMSFRKPTVDERAPSNSAALAVVDSAERGDAGTPQERDAAGPSPSTPASNFSEQTGRSASRRSAPWIDSALFLIAWLPAA